MPIRLFLAVVYLAMSTSLFAQRSQQQRKRWNKNLTKDSTYRFSKEPNLLLVETIRGIKPGKALDVGMGQGRNSIFLAAQGWDVTGFDIADEAVALAQTEAQKKNLKINTSIESMEDFEFGINQWDLIVFVYERCIEKTMANKLSKSLKKNGIVIFEFFHRDVGLKEHRPNFGCATNTVKNTFEKSGEFKILKYSEEIGIADYGLQEYKLVKLVAEKN